MKIRSGFVSNSSSSSFVLYGACIDTKVIVGFLDKHGVTLSKDELDDRYSIAERLDQYFVDNNIKCSATGTGGSYDNTIQVGRSPFEIGDNETGKQFRDAIEVALKEIDSKVSAYEIDDVIEN